MTIRRAAVTMATMLLLSSASIAFVSTASGYEFVDCWCHKVHIPDGSSLEKATEGLLDKLVEETPGPAYSTLQPHCTDAADDGYTQHGEASCGGGDGDCAECLADAKKHLLSYCQDRLGGQAHEQNGVCSIRFENYHFCQPN